MDSDFSSVRIELLVAVVVLLVVYFVRSFYGEKKRLPPGPIGLPIVGYLPFITRKPLEKFEYLRKKYKDLYTVKFASTTVLIVSEAKLIRDILSRPEVLGRPDEMNTNLVPIKMPLSSSGKIWLEHRRFALRSFRDLGLGKSKFHDLIEEEVSHFLRMIAQEGDKDCDVRKLLIPSTSNNICSLILGQRYDYDHPDRVFLDDTMSEMNKHFERAAIVMFFPWLKNIPFVSNLLKVDKVIACINALEDFILKKMIEHKKTLDVNDPRNFIDIYLIEMNARRKKDPDTTLSEDCLPGTIQNFFAAGGETVRISMEWALYTMAAFPDIQERVQREMDSVIGFERPPCCDDMKHLPYVQAVLTELQRWKTIVPIGPMRSVLEEFEIQGYTIPKGTVVLPNFNAAHYDPEYWKNPSEFKPERFLSQDGKSVLKHDNYLAFSCGKRACPGEGLAITEIFLYFSSVLQKYTIKLPEGVSPDLVGVTTMFLQLKSTLLRFIPRT